MISLDDAQRFVLGDVHPLAPVTLGLADALGCVCAAVVSAREPSPRFVNSSMDGFALRAKDTQSGSVQLRLVDSIFAGDVGSIQVNEGEAARIMTGAPLPEGADSVCMREETTLTSDERGVVIHRSVRRGESVRLVGEDVVVGQVLLSVGSEIGPAHLGVLAGQGISTVMAHPRPRVGVLSTGNELADTNDAVGPGKIRDANRPSLLASLAQSGFTPVDLGIAGDTPADITSALERGMHVCDAIISTGGVSVGDADFVKGVLAELTGGHARSMQVAIKPGKPFAFGVTSTTGMPFFGLAGNPVSTLVGFEVFVRPALRHLAGHRELFRPTFRSILDCPITRRTDGKLHFVHVTLRAHHDGRLHVKSIARQASHLLSAIADCNAIAVVPDGDGVGVGQEVDVMVLDADLLNGA